MRMVENVQLTVSECLCAHMNVARNDLVIMFLFGIFPYVVYELQQFFD